MNIIKLLPLNSIKGTSNTSLLWKWRHLNMGTTYFIRLCGIRVTLLIDIFIIF